MTSVLIDGRELDGDSATSGVGTFIRCLLTGLSELPEIDVRALATDGTQIPDGVGRVPIRRFAHGGRRAVLEHEVVLPFDLLRDRAAVFHNPLFHPPWRVGRPWVQTLFDVIPLVFPDPNLDVLRRRWRRFAPRYRRADAVVAISRHAADEGIRHLGLDPAKVRVAHLGVDESFRPAAGERPDGRPYVLVVSEYSRRKGFADAFAVVAALADAGLPHSLKVAGRVPPHLADELHALVRAAPRPDLIEVLGFVDDLPSLYRGADGVLVASRYEGFGLPALEAMASGVPVVAYDNSSLPEVIGSGGLVVADGDVSALATAVRSLLTEPARHHEMRERGLRRARDFDWATCAAALCGGVSRGGEFVIEVSVAIDARRLQDAPLGGVGRALACMLPGIASRADVTLLTDGRRPAVATPVRQVALASRLPGPEALWLHDAARRWQRRHVGLFHGTFNALPVGLRGPAVVTIHDLSFEVHPEDFGRPKRELFRRQARSAAKRAATVLTVSRFSADQILDQYGLSPDRVVVIPHAVDPRFAPSRADESIGSMAPAGRYIVAVGGAARRGLDVALEAWRRVRAAGADVDLVVIGEGRLGPEPGLHDLGRPDDATWASLLARAEVLCFPTRYEGFGMPALEAAASGTVVVCARVASLPEVLGEAGAWCEDTSVDAVTDQLQRVLTDSALASELRRRGLARAAEGPSWDEVAAQHVEIYRAAT